MGILKKIIEGNNWICRKLKESGWLKPSDSPSLCFRQWIEETIGKDRNLRILEIGGSSRPFLDKGTGSEYVGLDIDPVVSGISCYDRTLVQSVEDPIEGEYDLVFSKFVHEHIRSNQKAIASITRCLADNGHYICLVPCGQHPYSIATRIVGCRLQRFLIRHLRSEFVNDTGYPAFYDYCTPREFRKLLAENGFRIEKVSLFWGASEYFTFCFPIFLTVHWFNRMAEKIGWRQVASGMVLHARRQKDSADPLLSKNRNDLDEVSVNCDRIEG